MRLDNFFVKEVSEIKKIIYTKFSEMLNVRADVQ